MNEEYTVVVKGFDVIISVSEEDGDNFDVTLYELGNEVYHTVIPIDVDENSEDANTEDVISYAAQAAVDLYEADRGTLGQGAGATMKKSKKACVTIDWQDWYLQLKDTEYRDQADQLLGQLLELEYTPCGGDDLDAANAEERRILYDLDMLNWDRLKTVDPRQTVIIVNARRKAYLYDVQGIQEFLEGFKGHPLEEQAIALIRELITVRNLQKSLSESYDDNWTAIQDIKDAMEELSLQYLQKNVVPAPEEEGIDIAPNMAQDIAELMDGVSFEEPLEPMIARRRSFEEVEEDHLQEKGKVHEGLDPAEVPFSEYPFEEGDKVTFKSEYNETTAGGTPRSVAKGTKATIDNLWDDQGDMVIVILDSGELFVVPTEVLK